MRSGHEWRWKRHDSLTINGSRWYRHSTERGGNAISFVQTFYNLPFPEAVTLLLGGERCVELPQAEPSPPKVPKLFMLPPANANMRRVYAYLTKQRCIAPDVLTHFAKEGTLYEDADYHNAVFVGRDENGIPRHAHKRSTLSQGRVYRGNVESSDPRYSFHHIGRGEKLYVFEAPIDALSYISLHKDDWRQHSYVALCGVADQALLHILETHPRIREPVLCLDNDTAGIAALKRISEKLTQMGYGEVSHLLSASKDWNGDLQLAQPRQELHMGI